jgi:hypothetical protein
MRMPPIFRPKIAVTHISGSIGRTFQLVVPPLVSSWNLGLEESAMKVQTSSVVAAVALRLFEDSTRSLLLTLSQLLELGSRSLSIELFKFCDPSKPFF